MTERVDMDRLADFVGGALDGTPDAEAVRRLVDTDPAWAAAHGDLAEAMASVSADLRLVGSRTDAVPEDVVARLDSVLRDLGTSAGAAGSGRADDARRGAGAAVEDGERTPPDGVARHEAGPARRDASGSTRPRTDDARPARAPGGTGPGGTGPGGTGPGRRAGGRRARWAAGLSALAAVIVLGVGVVATLPSFELGSSRDNATSAGEAGDAAAPAAAPPAAAPPGGPPAGASGRDYRPGAFDGLADGSTEALSMAPAPATGGRSTRSAAGIGTQAGENDVQSNVPPELARLVDVTARQDCLEAIRLAFGGRVIAVDLARFNGRPALIALLNGASVSDGRPWVVVAGPDCGRTPGDTQELYHGPLA